MLKRNLKLALLTTGAALALAVSVACGDDDDSSSAGNGDGVNVEDSGGTAPVNSGGGMVAPDTFLQYDGRTYRLVELEQASFVDEAEFEQVGAATDADIDYEGELAVYERDGDDGAVWTFAPGDEGPASDFPAFWYRWTLEP